MRRIDLLLLHPPSTFRSPTRLGNHGMVAASVPSTPAIEMYPLGFLSMGEYLERHGKRAALCNLALVTSLFPGVSARRALRCLRPSSFLPWAAPRLIGVDLHWASNADGALDAVRAARALYPRAKVVMGGLTASFFWRDLMARPEVDFVLRGDSTEHPLLCLVRSLDDRDTWHEVPNLCWKTGDGEVRENGITWLPTRLDDYRTDYGWIFRSAAANLDPFSLLAALPYRDWLLNPATAVITQRGCRHGCVFCGGSAHAYRRAMGRDRVGAFSPEAVARDVAGSARLLRSRIFLAGDLRDPDRGYADEVFARIAALGLPNQFIIEVFRPAGRAYFEKACSHLGRVTLHFTADTHDEALRHRAGRPWATSEVESTIAGALAAGVEGVRVFFSIGLPGQTEESVHRTVDYCSDLLDRFGRGGRFHPFLSILAPCLEPASLVYDDPDRYGYTNLAPGIEDIAATMREPSWVDTLGYETSAMDRATLAKVTCEAQLAMNAHFEAHGLLSRSHRARQDRAIRAQMKAMTDPDRLLTPAASSLTGETSLYVPGLRSLTRALLAYRPLDMAGQLLRGLSSIVRSMGPCDDAPPGPPSRRK